ncbi:unnamed protein product [Phytomonas sp. EM1]|nr:unnamed protein product [Phytomonas sp. EM1]|eukprot:CCW63330.1 unnamed protein product [Phytomonas sp. isolate EM1]
MRRMRVSLVCSARPASQRFVTIYLQKSECNRLVQLSEIKAKQHAALSPTATPHPTAFLRMDCIIPCVDYCEALFLFFTRLPECDAGPASASGKALITR